MEKSTPVSEPSAGGQLKRGGSEQDELEDNQDEQYPWEHVDASRHNHRLQQRHKPDEAFIRYEGKARPCPKCGKASRDLAWFYFESPPWTWQNLCGRAGWMIVCDVCHVQVDFFLDVLN